jgi:hypothetical protein
MGYEILAGLTPGAFGDLDCGTVRCDGLTFIGVLLCTLLQTVYRIREVWILPI